MYSTFLVAWSQMTKGFKYYILLFFKAEFQPQDLKSTSQKSVSQMYKNVAAESVKNDLMLDEFHVSLHTSKAAK